MAGWTLYENGTMQKKSGTTTLSMWNFFFETNDIEDEGKKRAIFLLLVEAKHLAVLKGLANNLPEVKKFDELVELMWRYIKPAPNMKLYFYQRNKPTTCGT